jgi:hypothetical protein
LAYAGKYALSAPCKIMRPLQKSVTLRNMKKGTIIFGLIAATFVLVYFSPQELMQVYINGYNKEKFYQA